MKHFISEYNYIVLFHPDNLKTIRNQYVNQSVAIYTYIYNQFLIISQIYVPNSQYTLFLVQRKRSMYQCSAVSGIVCCFMLLNISCVFVTYVTSYSVYRKMF